MVIKMIIGSVSSAEVMFLSRWGLVYDKHSGCLLCGTNLIFKYKSS